MPTPALYALVDGFVMTPPHVVAIGLGLVALILASALALPLLAAGTRERKRSSLRLVPTSNAWGYSERATLDESAVGL